MRALVIAAVFLAGCGSSSTFTDSEGNQVTEEQVAAIAGFVQRGDSWAGPGGCRVDRILLGADEVEAADGAVVTNPAGTVGVAFPGAPECRELLVEALAIIG